MVEVMAQVHMSEAEVARDLRAALDKVRQGIEVVIEQDARPVAVIRSTPPQGRLLSECIALAEARPAMGPAILGVVLDSSVIIDAERQQLNVAQFLKHLVERIGESEAAVSSITVAELAHGIYRADTPARGARRRAFLDDLKATVPVYAITDATAEVAGRISGDIGMATAAVDRPARRI